MKMMIRSLYLATLTILLLFGQISQSYCQQTSDNDSLQLCFPAKHNFDAYKLYNVRVKLMEKRSFQGILLEATDSTIVLASSKMAHHYSSGDYQPITVPVTKIKRLTISNNDGVNQKVAEYTVDGVLSVWEGAAYTDMPNSVEGCVGCFMASVLLGGAYGVIRGTISGTKKEKYYIDGNYINYYKALYDLRYFSAYLD